MDRADTLSAPRDVVESEPRQEPSVLPVPLARREGKRADREVAKRDIGATGIHEFNIAPDR